MHHLNSTQKVLIDSLNCSLVTVKRIQKKTLTTGLSMICKVFITKQYLVVLAKFLIAIKDNVSEFLFKIICLLISSYS